MDYIIQNIEKVKSIIIKKDEESDADISIGFVSAPADGDDFGVGEVTMFYGFNLKDSQTDAGLIKLIASVLKTGARVTKEGVSFLIQREE